MALADLQDCSCTASASPSLPQPFSISSASPCRAALGSPSASSVRSRAYQCALQMQHCSWVSTRISIVPATAPSLQQGTPLRKQRHSLVFAHQQDVGSSRQSHEQLLERCLEAPAAVKTSTKEWEKGKIRRVAYQGHVGAYSHAVIDEVYGYGTEAIPYGEFAAAFSAVESRVADLALIPIQNSLDGSIHRNYDLLLRNRLHIVAEVPWKVRHCLLARPGTHLSQLRRVFGHPQALSHCHQTLVGLGFSAQSLYAIDDTVLAVQGITDSTGIVASSKAAHAFGLSIISDGIQDDTHNVTRFLQLAREQIPPPPPHLCSKTTVAFMLKSGPSDLHRVLSAFASRGIKVTNLESRPARLEQQLGQDMGKGALAAGQFRYIFVVDIQGSSASPEARTAFKLVQSMTSYFRVLGSYPILGKN